MHQQTECGANMECVPQRVANRRVWWCQWVPMVGANGSHNASWVIVCGGSGEGNVLDGKEMMHEHVPFFSRSTMEATWAISVPCDREFRHRCAPPGKSELVTAMCNI